MQNWKKLNKRKNNERKNKKKVYIIEIGFWRFLNSYIFLLEKEKISYIKIFKYF